MAGAKTSFRSNIATALSKYVSNTNYLGGVMQNGISQLSNKKWSDFEELGIRRREALQRNSVGGGLIHPDNQNIPTSVIGGRFNPFANVLYASLDAEKANRIYEYRLMSSFSEVSDCLMKIANNFISQNHDGEVVTFKYTDGDLAPEILEELTLMFKDYVAMYDFKRRGKKYVKDLLVDGEIYFEQIINTATEFNKEKGVLGVQKLPAELMETVYKDKTNGVVGVYVGRQITFDATNPQQITNINFVPYQANQVVCISSGQWDPNGEWIVPFIERARKRYIQLSYLEDAIVIYRLVRAPERLVFTVDTGTMPAPKAERYLKDLQSKYWKTKTFDINTQDIQSKFQPQAMLDAFWMSKGANGEGVGVSTIGGGQNLGSMEDLDYFIKALYRAMHVPTSFLDSNSTASVDSSQILNEQLDFADFIIDLQHCFEEGIKQGFISHLKLTKKYKEWGLRENKMEVEFVPPTDYYEMRRMQSLQIKADAFSKIASNDFFSKSWAAKHVMGLTPGQIKLQYSLRKKEAVQDWEIGQIQSNGPLWKKMMFAQMQGGGQGEGGPESDMDMGGDMDFGDEFGGPEGDFGGADLEGGFEEMSPEDLDAGMEESGSDAGEAAEAL